MEDPVAKICPNCKREIPSVNFTIHSVHCARNIRICPVCKEPVPQSELQDHHDKMHKLLPCKKCGESICGTDLEDHVRDSCALTIKTCRFCELELPRRELPAHENYCGVRTEQCPDCNEWVMIKYRQLHIDSNHGFLRLDDDPTPAPQKSGIKNITFTKPLVRNITNCPSTSNGLAKSSSSKLDGASQTNGYTRNYNNKPVTEIRHFGEGSSNAGSSIDFSPITDEGGPSTIRPPLENVQKNETKTSLKRINDESQINANIKANKIDNNLAITRGAVKKRLAPKPPVRTPPPDPGRDQCYYSALQRQQRDEKERERQTAYNLSVGLPPVLSPAAKVEKLRKLDALQNPETLVDYKDRVQGRVFMSANQESPGHVLGTANNKENERRREEFKNLKPMTINEFMERFNKMQVAKEGGDNSSGDRFSEIKSSLRELRRGLNEVTAPYNLNLNAGPTGNSRNARRSPPSSPTPAAGDEGHLDDGAVRLPCEFCATLVPAEDLVQHQTGCRPDLTQFRPENGAARVAFDETSAMENSINENEPVIPCEFCTKSLPIYLISEHQERCGREASLLYPD